MGMETVQSPAEHVNELLDRAQNPFDVTDSSLARLEGAVLCHVELHGWRQRKAPAPALRCSSYRHVFLLRDGSLLPLWELRYDSGNGARTLHEVYESAEALTRSEQRLQQVHGSPEAGPHGGTADHGRAGGPYGQGGGAGHDPLEFLPATSAPCGHRAYAEDDSPDHARRLLRRAENADRPGEEVWRLLATSRGHEILPVPRPPALADEWQVWCSVYEHAFLLADGGELSLYELEHDLSGSGRLVCEVYLDEAVADRAAHRLAREHGFGL